MTIQMHKKVKITVLRTEYDQELAEQYAIPNLGKCPFHQKGQVLYSDGINPVSKPEWVWNLTLLLLLWALYCFALVYWFIWFIV